MAWCSFRRSLRVCGDARVNLGTLVTQCAPGVQPHPAPESSQSASGQVRPLQPAVLHTHSDTLHAYWSRCSSQGDPSFTMQSSVELATLCCRRVCVCCALRPACAGTLQRKHQNACSNLDLGGHSSKRFSAISVMKIHKLL
jgi:hypothetical protein